MKVEISSTVGRFVEAMAKAPDVMMRHVDQGIQRAAIEAARQMRQDAPKNKSTLANSITNQRVDVLSHRAIALAGYAAAVHEGVGPGSAPPMEALRSWAKTAQIRPLPGSTERDFLFRIRRKIFRDGIPAKPFSETAASTTPERLRELIPSAIDAGMSEALA